MDRFTVTRVDKDVPSTLEKIRQEIAINVNDLDNTRRNSKTVPYRKESRKFSLAQLTR